MATEISVTQKAFTWLGSAFEKKSGISPFANFAMDGFTEEDKKELEQIGLINGEGVMNAECYAALEPLANASKFTSFKLASNYGVTERFVYFSGSDSVSVDNAAGRVAMQFPPDNASYAEFIGQFTGNSVLTNSSFSYDLELYDALVFAGLIDISRIKAMQIYSSDVSVAGEHSGGAMSFSVDEIAEFIKETRNAGKWLTGIVQGIAESTYGVSTEIVKECINKLYANNIVDTDGERVILTGKAADFAGNFLVVENIISLKYGAEDDTGAVRGTQCFFLQAGLCDILQIDPSGGKVRFESVSSAVMLDYISALLNAAPDL